MEDSMAVFLNRLVDETLVLTGPHSITREWSSEYCQQILLIDKETPKDWCNILTLAEMKLQSVDPKSPAWYDEVAKWANTLYTSQDSRSFAITLQFMSNQFSFVVFDCGGSVCFDMLGIDEDSKEYLRLVLFSHWLIMVHSGIFWYFVQKWRLMAQASWDWPFIILGGDCWYIQSNIFGDMMIEMVLFISNNLHGRGTVVCQVTLPKLQITEALECNEKNLNRGVLQKWLNTMDDTASIVVKDTWVDLSTPHTEGMVLNYLRLKGVLDFMTLHMDSELSMIERCHGGD
jgi:hypothetical protein